jgi:hypothetical protein
VLAISIAVCSQSSLPRFFVTNDTSLSIPGSGGGANVFEIVLNAGLGNWTGLASEGGVLAVENVDQTSFEVGVSNSGESFVLLKPLPSRIISNTCAHRPWPKTSQNTSRSVLEPGPRFLCGLSSLWLCAVQVQHTFHSLSVSPSMSRF